MTRRLVLPLLVLVAVAGCGPALPGTPKPAGSAPTSWPTNGGVLVRPTPLPPARLLGYLPEVSRGHVLCNAVGAAWPGLLGGEAKLEAWTEERCHAVSAGFDVAVELTGDRVVADRDIAGHRAEVGPDGTQARVELVAPAEAKRYPDLAPTLAVTVKTRARAADGVAVAVAEALLRGLPAAAGTLPEVDDKGELTRVAAREPLPGFGIADQPLPVVSEQLCTVLAAELASPPPPVRVRATGHCEVRGPGYTVVASLAAEREGAFDTGVGGRPARRDGSGAVVVRLRDGSPQVLTLRTLGAAPGQAPDWGRIVSRVSGG
ncbi:hypothetical protein JOF53_006677 [Crossiella equi]|uniref:LigA protein n=1 Tax=Crossiella equi TaxID=130796 RepID=A0ABS5AQ53_9PSEU|nr:hypothetical protein [Crossiella equi]MBP2477805.1 hypothetical protein [Crossiella equi]